MGLASALTTALTGLNAAETTVDVVGNNLANSNTVGFKASEASFATQFLQTLSLGGSPTESSGGTNPEQIGLGTVVAAITPDFSQGTIETSSDTTDMAIQGEGFFIVQGASGEQLYTRNGEFELNSENELVTATGYRVLGYGVNDDYEIQATVLEPIEIPLGATAVAEATENAYLEGSLSPTGDLADTGSIIQTGILGTDDHVYPATAVSTESAEQPNTTTAGTTYTESAGGDMEDGDVYTYRIVYAKRDPETAAGYEESMWVEEEVTIGADGARVTIANIPHSPADGDELGYEFVRIYRRDSANTNYYLIDEQDLDTGTFTYIDTEGVGGYATDVMDTGVLDGEYTYYVTYGLAGASVDPDTGMMSPESNSRPSPLTTSAIRVSNGRVVLTDIPTLDENPDGWQVTRLWRRNNTSDESEWHLVAEIPSVTVEDVTVIDEMPDAEAFEQAILDLDGPRIGYDTLLVDVVSRDEQTYENVFQVGTLEFTGRKGGRELSTKELVITAETTVQQLLDFMEEAMGIVRASGSDPDSDIPADAVTGDQPGGYIENGRLCMLGNTGTANELSIGLSGMLLEVGATDTDNVNLPWSTVQSAVGESAVTDFVVYDSLGIPLNVRLTAVLESRDGNSTTYRWFADSADNDPSSGVDISVGTGLIVFDGEGNVISTTNRTVSIDRRHVASASPLEFDLDFSQVSGLATNKSTLACNRQDGSAAGTLTGFIIGEDGVISGVFSNGMSRDLGQLRLARFANTAGLEQKGQNMYAAGVNSGLAVVGDPGEQGIGSIVAGALELSNTDIGADLIKLILASTMYQGNSRVITTSQEMLDVLLNLQR